MQGFHFSTTTRSTTQSQRMPLQKLLSKNKSKRLQRTANNYQYVHVSSCGDPLQRYSCKSTSFKTRQKNKSELQRKRAVVMDGSR